MDEHFAAGQGKGVQVLVLDHVELVVELIAAGIARHLVAQIAHVVHDRLILNHGQLLASSLSYLLADARLAAQQ